jgi:hypothetical protein
LSVITISGRRRHLKGGNHINLFLSINPMIQKFKLSSGEEKLFYIIPIVLEGAYPVRIDSGKDSNYSNDSFDLLVRKKEDIEGPMESSKEHTESILTIPTIPTKEETCQYCGYMANAYWFKHHQCR